MRNSPREGAEGRYDDVLGGTLEGRPWNQPLPGGPLAISQETPIPLRQRPSTSSDLRMILMAHS